MKTTNFHDFHNRTAHRESCWKFWSLIFNRSFYCFKNLSLFNRATEVSQVEKFIREFRVCYWKQRRKEKKRFTCTLQQLHLSLFFNNFQMRHGCSLILRFEKNEKLGRVVVGCHSFVVQTAWKNPIQDRLNVEAKGDENKWRKWERNFLI